VVRAVELGGLPTLLANAYRFSALFYMKDAGIAFVIFGEQPELPFKELTKHSGRWLHVGPKRAYTSKPLYCEAGFTVTVCYWSYHAFRGIYTQSRMLKELTFTACDRLEGAWRAV
jgi:hypothetical protein